MAIGISCYLCKYDLMEMGAIYLTPPNKKGRVKKRHICVHCDKIMKQKFEEIRILLTVTRDMLS